MGHAKARLLSLQKSLHMRGEHGLRNVRNWRGFSNYYNFNISNEMRFAPRMDRRKSYRVLDFFRVQHCRAYVDVSMRERGSPADHPSHSRVSGSKGSKRHR
jgi:hypothetical protein